MIKYYNSGLGEVSIYSEHYNEDPFYTTHCLKEYCSDEQEEEEIVTRLLKEIKYNLPLIAAYYHDVCAVKYIDDNDMHQKIQNQFKLNLIANLYSPYYEPLIYNEKIALECNLVPFQWNGMNLLSVGWIDNTTHFFKLEAYQLLVHGTVGENSDFVQDFQDKNLEKYVSDNLRKEAIKKLLNKFFSNQVHK